MKRDLTDAESKIRIFTKARAAEKRGGFVGKGYDTFMGWIENARVFTVEQLKRINKEYNIFKKGEPE